MFLHERVVEIVHLRVSGRAGKRERVRACVWLTAARISAYSPVATARNHSLSRDKDLEIESYPFLSTRFGKIACTCRRFPGRAVSSLFKRAASRYSIRRPFVRIRNDK